MISGSLKAQVQEESNESYLQTIEKDQLASLDDFQANPLNLNKVSEDDLQLLGFLTKVQIVSFLQYRREHGDLLAVEELQEIPNWDNMLIRKILPYVFVGHLTLPINKLINNNRTSTQQFICTYANKINSNNSTIQNYVGANYRLTFRYQLIRNKYLQAGFIGDKDSGEPFFNSKNKTGFDHYGGYVCLKKYKKIDCLIIGDFEVQLGQGLIHWQSMSFKKSGDIMNVERQSPWIKPHKSTDELNFSRGIGISIYNKRIQYGLFASLRSLSALIEFDSMANKRVFHSINTSGYHRTISELIAKNKLSLLTIGNKISYPFNWGELSFNQIFQLYSSYLKKRAAPYNLYAIEGKIWQNHSISLSFTKRNIHFFSEAALDKNMNSAIISSILVSAGSKLDFTILYRGISKKYQSLSGNAFTESTTVTNENGIYSGLAIKPTSKVKINFYCDLYSFPWLRYLKNAPMHGIDFLFQLNYLPAKNQELLVKFRKESKSMGEFLSDNGQLVLATLSCLRIQYSTQLGEKMKVLNRMEFVNSSSKLSKNSIGFLAFTDVGWKSTNHLIQLSFRGEVFDIGDYESRIYAFEPEPAYNFSLPAKMGIGSRFLVNFGAKIGSNWRFWFKVSKRFEIRNELKNNIIIAGYESQTEIKCQLAIEF